MVDQTQPLFTLTELAHLFSKLKKQNEITVQAISISRSSEENVEECGEIYGYEVRYDLRCNLDNFQKILADFLRERASRILRYDPTEETMFLSKSSSPLTGYFHPDDPDQPWVDFWDADTPIEILDQFENLIDEEPLLDKVITSNELARLFSDIKNDDELLQVELQQLWQSEDYISDSGQIAHYSVNESERSMGNIIECLAEFIRENEDDLLVYDSNEKTVSMATTEICEWYVPDNPEEPFENFWKTEKISDETLVDYFIESFS